MAVVRAKVEVHGEWARTRVKTREGKSEKDVSNMIRGFPKNSMYVAAE